MARQPEINDGSIPNSSEEDFPEQDAPHGLEHQGQQARREGQGSQYLTVFPSTAQAIL